MKHKSNNKKIELILTKLSEEYKWRKFQHELRRKEREEIGFETKSFEGKITRYSLRGIIIGAINVMDRHIISAWIRKLENLYYITQNPTSHLTKNKKKIMPTNDTLYYIEMEEIENRLTTHTPPNEKGLQQFLHRSTDSLSDLTASNNDFDDCAESESGT